MTPKEFKKFTAQHRQSQSLRLDRDLFALKEALEAWDMGTGTREEVMQYLYDIADNFDYWCAK